MRPATPADRVQPLALLIALEALAAAALLARLVPAERITSARLPEGVFPRAEIAGIRIGDAPRDVEDEADSGSSDPEGDVEPGLA